MAWLYKQKDSANWWIGYRVGKKQFSKSTGTPDREKAEKERAKVHAVFEAHKAGLLDQVYEALSGKIRPVERLKTAAEKWLQECSHATAQKTFEKYTAVLNQFCLSQGANDASPGPRVDEITPEQVRMFLQQRRAARSASTVNLEKKILSIFFRWCIANQKVRENPTLPVRRFREGQNEERAGRRPFKLDELQLIYSKAPNDFWRYMIVGGFYTGLRMGDLITLAWELVDFQKRFVHTTSRKTNVPVHIPLHTEFERMLTHLHKAAGSPKRGSIWEEEAQRYEQLGSGPFSNAFYDEILAPCGLVPVRRSKKKAKEGRATRRELNAISFHCLRHSFVTLVKMNSGSQAVAKELAGHSSDIVNDLYTHIPEGELVRAIQPLPTITSRNNQIELFPDGKG